MNPSDTLTQDEAIRSFERRPGLVPLRPGVQHYAWGDPSFIPSLLGINNADNKPFAELWMGAHPDLPAQAVVHGVEIPLDRFIARLPRLILGPSTAARFSARLPFLLKVLSASAPLSIQAHPGKKHAEEGFARENTAGIALSAPHRNYRDDNHKPELIVALTDFYALRGFRPLSQIAQLLRGIPEFEDLAGRFQPHPASLKSLYQQVMTIPQNEVDSLLSPLVSRLSHENERTPFAPTDFAYWVLRADQEFCKNGHRDRGLFSVCLLNLIHLHPREAMYLPAGVLHAYLHGSGMEVMASSNNVLRGGLTAKHVDVPELLSNITFEGGEPERIQSKALPGRLEWVYRAPASEFQLRRIEIGQDQIYSNKPGHGPEIAIVLTATEQLVAQDSQQILHLGKGDVFLAPFDLDYRIHAGGPAVLYKATVPNDI